MSQPHCQHCKGTERLHINSRKKSGLIFYMCAKCTVERCKKYRKTKNGKKAVALASKRTYRKFPEKQKARVLLKKAVEKGFILKPENCSMCKNKKVEAHHPDYNKPFDVVWVCSGCHANIHKNL